MNLYDEIVKAYPELTDVDFGNQGSVILKNDGLGDYIEKWSYSQPIPNGLKLGKIKG